MAAKLPAQANRKLTVTSRVLFWFIFGLTSLLAVAPAYILVAIMPEIEDASQHVVGFAILGFLGSLGYPEKNRIVFAGLLVFAIATEVVQGLIGWRGGDWRDFSADVVGMLFGFFLLGVIRKVWD